MITRKCLPGTLAIAVAAVINIAPRSLAAPAEDAQAYVSRANHAASAEAIECCNKALSLNPKLGDAYILRANAYRKIGQQQKAIDDYTALISLQHVDLTNETMSSVYIYRSEAHDSLGQFQQSIADCTNAINAAKDPRDLSWAYQTRAMLHAKMYQYKDAMNDFSKVTELFPQESATFMNKALIELKFCKYDDAAADYTQSIELDPRNGAAFGWRAKAYGGLGDKEKRDQDLAEAKKLGFSETEDYVSKGSSSKIEKVQTVEPN